MDSPDEKVKMKPTILWSLRIAGMFAMVCAPLVGQQGTEPPNVLKVTRVAIKPGQTGAYAGIASTDIKLLSDAKWPRVSIAMRSVTGPEEIVYLTGFESLGAWEADDAMLNKSPLLKFSLEEAARKADVFSSGTTTFTLSYKSDMSFKPRFVWSDMKCMDLITVRLKPGHGDEYLANRKIVVEAHTGADIHEHLLLYSVTSGITSSTFIVLRPLDSLHAMDLLNAEHDSEKYGTVLGDANRAKLHALFAASVEQEEERYYCADPALSYVTPEWVKTNKDFWVPSPR
jgi:hypothetical protein